MLFTISPFVILFLAALYLVLFISTVFMAWLNEKGASMVIWICVISFCPFLGPLLYVFYDLFKKRSYLKRIQL